MGGERQGLARPRVRPRRPRGRLDPRGHAPAATHRLRCDGDVARHGGLRRRRQRGRAPVRLLHSPLDGNRRGDRAPAPVADAHGVLLRSVARRRAVRRGRDRSARVDAGVALLSRPGPHRAGRGTGVGGNHAVAGAGTPSVDRRGARRQRLPVRRYSPDRG